jgi:poly-beta-1,6-N-acetyl-D-glucosamine synthase
MLFVSTVLFLCYFCFVAILLSGWSQVLSSHKRSEHQLENFISVIVPVRNEARNITSLLSALLSQEYSHFEIIIVDDHSTDDTGDVVIKFGSRVRFIKNYGAGKKTAVSTGVAIAKGSVIVTTDADCTMSSQWLTSINEVFSSPGVQMAIGPVKIAQHDFFSTLQSIEFSSLIGSTAAMTAFQRPIMCNGANLAYRKSVFDEVNAYGDNLHIASGDDEFLMRKVYERYPPDIKFMADPRSVVTTTAQGTLHDLFQQRIRWAAKWRFNTAPGVKLLAIFIIAVQCTACFSLVSVALNDEPLYLILLLMKALLESVLLIQVSRFLKMRWSWFAFLVLQVTYPFYVVLIGVLSNVLSFRWKGRIHP